MNEGQKMEEQFALLLETLKNQQMSEFRGLLLALYIYEQGQLYQSLDEKDRQHLYSCLPPKELADMFDVTEEDNESIKGYLVGMRPSYAADMLTEMYTGSVVDLLDVLDKSQKAKYLGLLSNEEVGEIKESLHYEDETARAIMTTEFVSIVANRTVCSVTYVLKSQADMTETIYYAYVIGQESHLVGVISLRDLIVNDNDTLIADILNGRVISVHVGDDQEDIAQAIHDYDFLAVPIADYDDHLLGIVAIDDIINIIGDGAASDYSGLAGIDVEKVSENPLKAAFRRLPWLITLLFLGMSTISLINNYESLASGASIPAAFISLITGIASNVETQSLVVAVRRLAMKDERGSDSGRLILSEVLTGLVTGAVTGSTIMIVVGVWQHNLPLGFVIGMVMLCAVTMANLTESLIPMLMDKLGFDPTVASGSFVTTLSDLTSVLIYFNTASTFVYYFA